MPFTGSYPDKADRNSGSLRYLYGESAAPAALTPDSTTPYEPEACFNLYLHDELHGEDHLYDAVMGWVITRSKQQNPDFHQPVSINAIVGDIFSADSNLSTCAA